MENNINFTTENNLCISCGICGGVCSRGCINYRQKDGLNIPFVNEECTQCGMCLKVCPGKGRDYTQETSEKSTEDFWFGGYKRIYSANSNDKKLLQNAVSGGVVTEIVKSCLKNKKYDAAFLVNSHQYGEGKLGVKKYELDDIDNLARTQKSRYLPVSHEETVRYMLSNREKKLIIVATSCCVQGILNVINSYKLKRENYLFIGLFCDKTMSFNVVRYFDNFDLTKKLNKLFFRTKEVGGWPGGVQLEWEDGSISNLKNTERMKVKEYFEPERCMYCLDKLNRYADISVGDNYTGENSSVNGSNSVIIRTEIGEKVWKLIESRVVVHEAKEEDIRKSQHLNDRKNNFYYAKYKEEKIGCKINIVDRRKLDMDAFAEGNVRKNYNLLLKKIEIGKKYADNPKKFQRLIQTDLLLNRVKARISRFLK